jgi:hypothetical protein
VRKLICKILGHKEFKLDREIVTYEGRIVGVFFPRVCVRCWQHLPTRSWKP